MTRDKELQQEILAKTQKCRVNFSSKQEMREYLVYYARAKEAFRPYYTPTEIVIIALSLMMWSRRKIVQNTRPTITGYQIRAMFRKMPCLVKLKKVMAQCAKDTQEDAMLHVAAALDINGEILIKEE